MTEVQEMINSLKLSLETNKKTMEEKHPDCFSFSSLRKHNKKTVAAIQALEKFNESLVEKPLDFGLIKM